jgi:hypothetical protein
MPQGQFYFAWSGGVMNPTPPITTTGDTHGSIATTFAVSGDILGTLVENISDINGLVVGLLYEISGPGIGAGTYFIYEGGNSVTLSGSASMSTSSATLVITAPVLVALLTGSLVAGQTTMQLLTWGGLQSGQLYCVVGSGIAAGTLFTYEGSPFVTLSQAALAGGTVGLSLYAIQPNDPFTIDNLGSTNGLIPGGQYAIAGPGIPAGSSFVYDGGSSVTIDQAATASAIGVPLIMVGPLVPNAAFDPSGDLVEDERIVALEITHNEGDFPSLKIDIKNPRIGLLAAGRQVWGWLSWASGGGVISIFNGRLVGVPERTAGEVVRLQFVACPNDYHTQKLAIAATWQQLPFWDPVWFVDRLFDPDTILETQPILWHIDRVSLAVTLSDINLGEDGTLGIHEGDHFYDELDVSYGQPPLFSINVTGTVSWTQQGDGIVDITPQLVQAFATPATATWYFIPSGYGASGLPPGTYAYGTIGAIQLTGQAMVGDYKVTFTSTGSSTLGDEETPEFQAEYIVVNPLRQIIGTGFVGGQFSEFGLTFTVNAGTIPFTVGDQFIIHVSGSGEGGGLGANNLIRSLTGNGLQSSWPQPGQSIGSGWSVAGGSVIEERQGLLPRWMLVPFIAPAVPYHTNLPSAWREFYQQEQQFIAQLNVSLFAVSLQLLYDAARPRTETIRFALAADIQPLVTDPGTSLVGEAINLQSAAVGQAVDPGGAIPIGDLRRNSYFKTDRGTASFEFLILMARAKLLARARCVKITFGTTFETGVNLSCRMNVQLFDSRLPGGQVIGKVESYTLLANEHDGQRAKVTIGATIGNGNTVTGTAGISQYVGDDYVDSGYQVTTGATTDLVGEVAYETLDDFVVLDDGVDLFNMTPSSVIQSLIVSNGFDEQVEQVTKPSLLYGNSTAYWPNDVLSQNATGVDLELVPLTGSFHTDFNPAMSLLMVPRTVDLAASAQST